jgi:hypothetical protein
MERRGGVRGNGGLRHTMGYKGVRNSLRRPGKGDGYKKRKQDNFIDLAFQDETELLIIGLL